MRRELIMPTELTGVGVKRDDRRGVEVVAFAFRTVVIGSGVTGAPVHQVEFRIVGARHPDRAAAMLPRFRIGATPRAVTRILGAGSRIEAPDLLSALHIVGIDETADAVL